MQPQVKTAGEKAERALPDEATACAPTWRAYLETRQEVLERAQTNRSTGYARIYS